MFNQFLDQFNQNPYNQNFKTIFDKYMIEKVQGKYDKVNHPFHLDCKVTGKIVCQCRLSEEQFMNKKSRERLHHLSQYLNDQYQGITDTDYRNAYYQIQLQKEKIQNMGEYTDLLEYIPRFKSKEKYEKLQEKKKKEQEQKLKEEQLEALKGLEVGMCYLCQKTHSQQFYDVYEKKKLYSLCHECCKQTRPSEIARRQLEDSLLHKRGKLAVHLRELKERLKVKKQLKTRLLEIEEEEELQDVQFLSDTDDEDYECNRENCFSEISSAKNPLIKCKSCYRTWHPQCLETPLNYKLLNRFEYLCTDCKMCVICFKSGGEESLLMCDCCDRAYHMDCRNPPIMQLPEGKWFCDDCVRCASCRTVLLTNENYNAELQEKYAEQTVKEKLICDNCWVFYQKKEYCPICYKIVKDNEKGNYVQCDMCNLWIHFKCEGLSDDKVKDIQKLDSYNCKSCIEHKRVDDLKNKLQEKLNNEQKIGKIDKQEKLPVNPDDLLNDNLTEMNEPESNIQSSQILSKRSTNKRGPQQDLQRAVYNFDNDSDSEDIDDQDEKDEDFKM